MGRILESLKQTPTRLKVIPPGPTLAAVPVELPTEEIVRDKEVSYIEVGPNRSMEASADVLASKPRNTLPLFEAVKPPLAPIHRHIPSTPIKTEETPISVPVSPTKKQTGLAPEVITYHQPNHQRSQQYRELLQSILQPQKIKKGKVFLFSGARPECGTTTVLLNMAVAAALVENLRVIVVDGNQRRPAIASRLGLEEAIGIREVMTGKATLDEAIRETDQAKLFALTSGMPGLPSGMRLITETVRSLIRQLRNRFDLVLVDGPRWDGQADVLLLSGACDGVYLVVSESEAESPQVDQLYQTIPSQGFNLAGCLLAGC